MENREKLSLNAKLKDSIIQIMGDSSVHTTEDIRKDLAVTFGLEYGRDYNKSHLGTAMHALKLEGYLVSVGRGKYLAGEEKKDSDFGESDICQCNKSTDNALEFDFAIGTGGNDSMIDSANLIVETRKSLISVIESHYHTCVEVLGAINQYDYVQASEEDLEHVGMMLRYKKSLENQLRELKKGL